MSRAESLANRIEEGAAQLAAFAEGLSEAEWRAPGSPNSSDRRTWRRRSSLSPAAGAADASAAAVAASLNGAP